MASWARGCHPSLGRPKGSLSSVPWGREEARLVVPQGMPVPPVGASPHWARGARSTWDGAGLPCL